MTAPTTKAEFRKAVREAARKRGHKVTAFGTVERRTYPTGLRAFYAEVEIDGQPAEAESTRYNLEVRPRRTFRVEVT